MTDVPKPEIPTVPDWCETLIVRDGEAYGIPARKWWQFWKSGKQATIESELARLPDLYALTGRDWCVELSNILTEPVSPTVTIYEEADKDSHPRYSISYNGNTFHEALKSVVDHIIADIASIEKLCPKEGKP